MLGAPERFANLSTAATQARALGRLPLGSGPFPRNQASMLPFAEILTAIEIGDRGPAQYARLFRDLAGAGLECLGIEIPGAEARPPGAHHLRATGGGMSSPDAAIVVGITVVLDC